MRWLPVTMLLAALPAQEPGAPKAGGDPALAMRVELVGAAAQGSVAFGAHFALSVVRSWPADATAEPFDAGFLAPLAVEAGPVTQTTEAGNKVETRRFDAWAFRRGAVTLQPSFGLVVPEGAPPRRTTAALCTLLVDSVLGDKDEGTAELPPAPALRIFPVRRELVSLLGLAAVAGLTTFFGMWLLRARRRRQPHVGPRAALLARIDALQDAAPRTRAEHRAAAVAATAVLDAAEAWLGDGALQAERTAARATVDAVKFAGHDLPPARRDALCADLRRLAAAVPEEASA